MASLDFPSNPVNGQTYALNGVTYYYNSSMGAWLTQLSAMNITASSNTQVLFNDATVANGSSGLTYNKAANTLTSNTLSVSRTLFVDTFIEFNSNVTYDYTISTGKNALSAGPVSIANGNTVTIPSGSFWTVT